MLPFVWAEPRSWSGFGEFTGLFVAGQNGEVPTEIMVKSGIPHGTPAFFPGWHIPKKQKTSHRWSNLLVGAFALDRFSLHSQTKLFQLVHRVLRLLLGSQGRRCGKNVEKWTNHDKLAWNYHVQHKHFPFWWTLEDDLVFYCLTHLKWWKYMKQMYDLDRFSPF